MISERSKPEWMDTVIKPDNIVSRYMEPALEKAGLRRFRSHDLRHTFGSLLIQDGASLAYVKGSDGPQLNSDHRGHLRPPDSWCGHRVGRSP